MAEPEQAKTSARKRTGELPYYENSSRMSIPGRPGLFIREEFRGSLAQSARRASLGLIREARRAGATPAKVALARSTSTATPITHGSRGCTS